MFIITNRNLLDKSGLDQFDKRPNTDGPNSLRMAEVTRTSRRWKVDIIPDILDKRKPEDQKRLAKANIDGAWLAKMGFDDGKLFGSRYVAQRILERVNPRRAETTRRKGRNLLIFVHGYNNNVEDVVERGWRFERNFGVEVLAFSWPANGGGISGTAAYLSDKHDAKVSVGALDRALAKIGDMLTRYNESWNKEILEKAWKKHPTNPELRGRMISELAEQGCPFKVTLLLHSMGNYLYKHLVLSSASLGTGLIFDNVILAAADANNKDHALWVDRIRARSRVFVTINENDGALRVSRLKGGEEQLARLGHYPYELDSVRAAYVDFTRVSKVGDSHAYFEGDPLDHEDTRRFFREAINGEAAETRLKYDPARNLYRFK